VRAAVPYMCAVRPKKTKRRWKAMAYPTVYALQKIYYPERTQEIILPPRPDCWIRPQRYGATVVQIIGVDELPEEFLKLALTHGWRFIGGKFYPSE